MENTTQQEIARRRTFAIISHPDAGKTTLTEKLLFLGGAIHKAGEVKGKAGSKAAMSDWMSMEQERGISITSSVMQIEHKGLHINLLDTPGHKDFSEDTYRTLTAADSAVMLLDVAKGVEAQTKKLYEVCRYRKLPIFSFINKLDRDGKVPLELLDEVESTLNMSCYPVTWPLGIGGTFKGLYHRHTKEFHWYQIKDGELLSEVYQLSGPEDKKLEEIVDDQGLIEQFREDLELLEVALGEFSEEDFLTGKVSPLTWGSAKYLFGVDLFLDLFADYAPAPQPRDGGNGPVDPQDKDFTGFVFKVQANMDKRHRDRVAFIRICSGKFERGMKVQNTRLGREVRLAYANQLMAQDRETVDIAYAGDIVGINDTGNFLVGDSVSTGKKVKYPQLPRFSPELFAKIRKRDMSKRKQLEKGLSQMSEEGTIQLFYDPFIGIQDPVIGVVGELQFEVLLHRLKEEYNLELELQRSSFSVARWPRTKEDVAYEGDIKGNMTTLVDTHGEKVVLLDKEWDLQWAERENPDVIFAKSIEPQR
ncbi:MAG: peptide chain release factor 3 [Bdellovibrionota bacterium]|nr:peptide chain release factor 3 [Pseudobdellovibrionaceae bacterium]|tara:strand:+ start:27136 stop:28734 length:1599 start_codon:yes stop_codon:yes gene_type:complete